MRSFQLKPHFCSNLLHRSPRPSAQNLVPTSADRHIKKTCFLHGNWKPKCRIWRVGWMEVNLFSAQTCPSGHLIKLVHAEDRRGPSMCNPSIGLVKSTHILLLPLALKACHSKTDRFRHKCSNCNYHQYKPVSIIPSFQYLELIHTAGLAWSTGNSALKKTDPVSSLIH